MPSRFVTRTALLLAVASTGVALGACDRSKNLLLNVDTPDIVTVDRATNAAGAQSFYVAAVGDFARFIGGDRGGSSPLGLNLTGGLLTDELISTRSGTEHVDNRSIVPSTFPISTWSQVGASYTRIIRALNALAQYPPATGGNEQLATLHAMEGMLLTVTAEHYCNGIPLWDGVSDTDPQTKTFTTAELYTAALAEFDKAISLTTSANLVNFATIGKARTILHQATPSTLASNAAAAAALVAAVPTTYKYNVVFGTSTAGLGNAIYNWANATKNFGAVDKEGINGLDYISSADPRIKVDPTKVSAGQDGTRTPALNQYTTLDAPVTVASGIEARMIEAESQLANNDPNRIVTLDTPGHDEPAPEPGGDEGLAAGPALPRARFLDVPNGARLGDMRRLVRQYGRGAETVYPTGPYFKGGAYGTDVVLVPQQEETNNPNWAGCTDKSA